jgi:CheY-like chemotaxis protein
VVLSAYGGDDDREATRRAGFSSHIVKPAEAPAIARALLGALEQARPS